MASSLSRTTIYPSFKSGFEERETTTVRHPIGITSPVQKFGFLLKEAGHRLMDDFKRFYVFGGRNLV